MRLQERLLRWGAQVHGLTPGMAVTGLFSRGFAECAVAQDDQVVPLPKVFLMKLPWGTAFPVA